MKDEQVISLLGNTCLAVTAAIMGVLLYESLWPGFYYIAGYASLMFYWMFLSVLYFLYLFTQYFFREKGADIKNLFRSSKPIFILGMAILVTSLIVLKVPLKASFLLAQPKLEEKMSMDWQYSVYAGLYVLDPAKKVDDFVIYTFLHDRESAIVYCKGEEGVKNLKYNEGNKGHIMGNWYWYKED